MYHVVTLCVFLLHIHTCLSHVDVPCILNGNAKSLCMTMVEHVIQQNTSLHDHPAYKKLTIPDFFDHSLYFKNCTGIKPHEECRNLSVNSITQVGKPFDDIEMCYEKTLDQVECHRIYYYYYSDQDKVNFLSKVIPHKQFYVADCIEYRDDKVLVCRPNIDELMQSSDFLVNGRQVKPKQNTTLLPHNFICELENKMDDRAKNRMNIHINCDLSMYVPYSRDSNIKKGIEVYKDVIFFINKASIQLKYNCKESWCGYSGEGQVKMPSRRDTTYRCMYAKGQQLCRKDKERTFNQENRGGSGFSFSRPL